MPRAHDAPDFTVYSHPVPAKTNPLGVKGCGEAGCAGALTSVMNAVVDALSVYGIKHIDMPATPERVWQAIQDAQSGNDHAAPGRRARIRHSRISPNLGRPGNGPPMTASPISHRPRGGRRHPTDRQRERGAFRQPFLHAGAAAAVRLRARRLRRELYRARPGAHRVQCRLGRAADAGRIPDRSHRTRASCWSRACCSEPRLRSRRGGELVLGAGGHVRTHRRRQHRVPSGRLRAALAPRLAGAHQPGLFRAHILRHARQRGGARERAAHAQPVRLAWRLFRRGRCSASWWPHPAVATRCRARAARGQGRATRPASMPLAAAAVAADPDELLVLHAAGVRQLRPAELLGRGTRRAPRHRPITANAALSGNLLHRRDRRAGRRLDRRAAPPATDWSRRLGSDAPR